MVAFPGTYSAIQYAAVYGMAEKEKQLYFDTYDDLWAWSVIHIADFWQSLWAYFGIKSKSGYHKVIEKPASGMIGT